MKLLSIFIYCGLYALLNVSGAALIKDCLKNTVLTDFKDWISFLFQSKVILGLVIIFASALIMFKALSVGRFSSVIPIATGINFVLTVLIGYFFFKDVINNQIILGFLLIILGIIIISLNSK